MKQQEPGEERRRQGHRQTFQLHSDELKRYGKRTGVYFGNGNPNDRSDGFARWSDYTDFHEQDGGYIPKDSTSNFSFIEKEPIGQYPSNDQTKLPEVELEDEPSKTVQQVITSPRIQRKYSKLPKEKIKQPQQSLQNNNRRVSTANNIEKKSQENVPFEVPGISSIKERKDYGRRSEQFLLELLKSQKTRRDEERRKAAEEQAREQKEKKEKEVRLNNEIEIESKKSNKMEIQQPIQKANDKKIEKPGNRQSYEGEKKQDKYRTRQLNPKEQKGQSQKSSRPSKRVTINDRGKIKLTTDSFSTDFDYILPPSLRKGQESTYHKRYKPSSPVDELHEPQTQPMDIIEQPQRQNYEEQEQKADVKKPSLKLERLKKQIRITQDPEKLVDPDKEKRKGMKGEKGQKEEKKGNKGSKKGSSRSNKSKGSKTDQKKSVSEPKIIHKGSQNSKKIEVKKKVRRGDASIVVETISSQMVSQPHERPQRNRSRPNQFWLGEKNAYNRRGSLVARCDFSSQQFLEMLGFSQPKNIKSYITNRTVKEISILIQLKPDQEIYSAGLNYTKMTDFFSYPQQFNLLTIESKKVRQKPHAQIVIDDFQTIQYDEQIEVKDNQTFSLRNLSDSKPCLFIITLFNSSKKKN